MVEFNYQNTIFNSDDNDLYNDSRSFIEYLKKVDENDFTKVLQAVDEARKEVDINIRKAQRNKRGIIGILNANHDFAKDVLYNYAGILGANSYDEYEEFKNEFRNIDQKRPYLFLNEEEKQKIDDLLQRLDERLESYDEFLKYFELSDDVIMSENAEGFDLLYDLYDEVYMYAEKNRDSDALVDHDVIDLEEVKKAPEFRPKQDLALNEKESSILRECSQCATPEQAIAFANAHEDLEVLEPEKESDPTIIFYRGSITSDEDVLNRTRQKAREVGRKKLKMTIAQEGAGYRKDGTIIFCGISQLGVDLTPNMQKSAITHKLGKLVSKGTKNQYIEEPLTIDEIPFVKKSAKADEADIVFYIRDTDDLYSVKKGEREEEDVENKIFAFKVGSVKNGQIQEDDSIDEAVTVYVGEHTYCYYNGLNVGTIKDVSQDENGKPVYNVVDTHYDFEQCKLYQFCLFDVKSIEELLEKLKKGFIAPKFHVQDLFLSYFDEEQNCYFALCGSQYDFMLRADGLCICYYHYEPSIFTVYRFYESDLMSINVPEFTFDSKSGKYIISGRKRVRIINKAAIEGSIAQVPAIGLDETIKTDIRFFTSRHFVNRLFGKSYADVVRKYIDYYFNKKDFVTEIEDLFGISEIDLYQRYLNNLDEISKSIEADREFYESLVIQALKKDSDYAMILKDKIIEELEVDVKDEVARKAEAQKRDLQIEIDNLLVQKQELASTIKKQKATIEKQDSEIEAFELRVEQRLDRIKDHVTDFASDLITKNIFLKHSSDIVGGEGSIVEALKAQAQIFAKELKKGQNNKGLGFSSNVANLSNNYAENTVQETVCKAVYEAKAIENLKDIDKDKAFYCLCGNLIKSASLEKATCNYLALLLLSAFMQKQCVALIGPFSKEIADGFSIFMTGRGVSVIDTAKATYLKTSVNQACGSVILLENVFMANSRNVLSLVKDPKYAHKFFIISVPYIEDLMIEPTTVTSSFVPIQTDGFISMSPLLDAYKKDYCALADGDDVNTIFYQNEALNLLLHYYNQDVNDDALQDLEPVYTDLLDNLVLLNFDLESMLDLLKPTHLERRMLGSCVLFALSLALILNKYGKLSFNIDENFARILLAIVCETSAKLKDRKEDLKDYLLHYVENTSDVSADPNIASDSVQNKDYQELLSRLGLC